MANHLEHPVWGTGLRAMRRSLYAQQIYESIVHEWQSVPGFTRVVEETDLVRLSTESTVERTRIIGHCIRLHFVPGAIEEETECLTVAMVRSIYQARQADKLGAEVLQDLATNGLIEDKWIQLISFWHQERYKWLKRAARAMRTVIPEEYWTSAKK